MEIKVNQTERRSWVEIDLDQIKTNYLTYKDLLPESTDIMAVIKADAYGHGDIHIAKWLAKCGCRLFGVSNIDEAVGLREAGITGEILILGYTSPKYARILYGQNLTQTLVSEEYADALSKTGYNVKSQFAIDTGMNRIGINGADSSKCIEIIKAFSSKLEVNGIFTHLCVADESTVESQKFTRSQIAQFRTIAQGVKGQNLNYIHCFNSAGGLFYFNEENEHSPIRGTVRLGIVLYGCKPDRNNILPETIKPALSWKSQISMVKSVYPGETVGYGRTYSPIKKSRIATVTTGYADGLDRHLSNRGFMLIKGHKAPIVGRICMDQTLIDVTDIPNVKMGDIVTILGKNGDIDYFADDMAMDLDTIGYEVLCNISKRVQRFYKTRGLLYSI